MIPALAVVLATVLSAPPPVQYSCTGVATVFTIPWPYLTTANLVVTSTAASGAVTTLGISTDYTVNPTIAPSTGTLTLTAGSKCPAGSVLKINRVLPYTQPQGFRTGAYSGPAHEQAFDRLEMQIQQIEATAASASQTGLLTAADWNRFNQVVFTSLNQFQAAGTGAVARPIGSKLSETVSVMDFGAVGNGVTDDTAAFTKAIAAMPSGGFLYLPCGNYLVTSTIAVSPTGLIIRGTGANCAKITVTMTGHVFDVTGALFALRDLEVNVGTTTTRTGAIVHAAAGQGMVDNVRFVGNGTSTNNGYVVLLDNDLDDNWMFRNIRVTGGCTWTSIFRLTLATGTIASTFISDLIASNVVYSVAAIDLDGAIDTFLVQNSDFPTYGGKAVWTRNAAGAGGGFPRWVHFANISTEAGNGAGTPAPTTAIQLDTVRDFQWNGGYIASAQVGAAIGSLAASVRFIGVHFVSMTQSAVTIANGSLDTTIGPGTVFEETGNSANNTYDTISVAANAANFNIEDCVFKSGLANKPRYSIFIAAGNTDGYQIKGNRSSGTATGFLSNGATGSNRLILGNTPNENDIISCASCTHTFNGGSVVANAPILANNGLSIGGASNPAISASLRGTATNPTAVAAQTCADTSITVTGAVVNAECAASAPGTALGNLSVGCHVSATNTVQLHVCNPTAGSLTPPVGTYSVRVFNP